MRTLLIIATIFLFNRNVFSQNDPCGKNVLMFNQFRKPIAYRIIREADVMWSKRIWQEIDVKEKINRIFKYPQETKDEPKRVALIDLLLCNILNQTLTAYDASVDDQFSKELSIQEIQRKIYGKFRKEDVVLYRIKEDWFFDKQTGKTDFRIIGICPIIQSRDDKGKLREGLEPLFWIYFPEARMIFANSDVYNSKDTLKRVTWDDIFNRRMFGSYIIKESNAKNANIDNSRLGLDQLLESKRIHDESINAESDMWEY